MKNFELNKLDNRYIICEIGKEGEYDGPTNSHLTITSIGEISISYTGEELLNKDSEIVKIIETIVVSY